MLNQVYNIYRISYTLKFYSWDKQTVNFDSYNRNAFVRNWGKCTFVITSSIVTIIVQNFMILVFINILYFEAYNKYNCWWLSIPQSSYKFSPGLWFIIYKFDNLFLNNI